MWGPDAVRCGLRRLANLQRCSLRMTTVRAIGTEMARGSDLYKATLDGYCFASGG